MALVLCQLAKEKVMKLVQNLIFVVTILLNVQNAYAACEDFIKNDTLLLKKDVAVQWSYADRFLSDKKTFDESKAKADGVLAYGPFHGDYQATQTFEETIDKKHIAKFDSLDKTDLMISNLSDNAVKAYKICIQGSENKPHLILSVKSYTNELVTVKVSWDDPSSGLVLKEIRASFTSGDKANEHHPKIPLIASGSSIDINYARAVGKEFALTVTAYALAGNGSTFAYGDSIRLPYAPDIQLKTIIQHRTNLETDQTGNKGNSALYLYGGDSNGGTVRSAIAYSHKPYYLIDPDTVTFAYKQVQGSCNMIVEPRDASGLTKTSTSITGDFALSYPPHCGGAVQGNLEWDEYYTEYYEDNVLLNPIP